MNHIQNPEPWPKLDWMSALSGYDAPGMVDQLDEDDSK